MNLEFKRPAVPERLKPLEARIKPLLDLADPNRFVTFRSALHDPKVAAILGIALGVTFFTCFITGMVSHVMQNPPSWYTWPARPAGFYRFTQGLHVASGLLAIPILLAKLWVIYPKLFEWPPIAGVAHFLERITLLPLIGGGLFMLVSGVANINQWYFFEFYFTTAHYAVGWITIGALIIHIGAKATIVREQVLHRTFEAEPETVAAGGLTRRGFLAGVFGTGALITTFTVGQSFSPLGTLALLAPRRPGTGPQKLPVNRTAGAAGVIAAASATDYSLSIEGAVAKPLKLSLAQLRELPQHQATLPIACVEGWSQSANWSGVPVRDLLNMVGAQPNAEVRIESMEVGSAYTSSVLNVHHAHDRDTLLALDLNDEPLHMDHGYPCRLIGPNRPGVLQTKWVHKVIVL